MAASVKVHPVLVVERQSFQTVPGSTSVIFKIKPPPPADRPRKMGPRPLLSGNVQVMLR